MPDGGRIVESDHGMPVPERQELSSIVPRPTYGKPVYRLAI